MSSEVGRRVTARRAWLVALAGGALVVGSAASAALGQTPDEVIDAGTNADAAAQALNEGCADMEKCDWKSDGDLTTDYGPARIIGDVLYNCSEEGDAETAVGVTDERGESTSVSESISLEISLGFLDLEKSSVEFEAFSKQSQSFSTEVKVTNGVSVAPGWKGWTEALMLSGGVTGSAYITQGIHLIQVKNIDLQFPGYQGPDAPRGEAQVVYSGTSTPMTSDEVDSRCAAVGASTASAAQAGRAARAARALAPRRERFKITVCRSKRASARSSQRGRRRCTKRTVTGVPPRRYHKRNVTATLERAGRVHAADTNRRGSIRLTQRRTITPGRYRLIMRKKPKKMIVRHNGKRLHRAEQHMITIVPLTIRWTRGVR
jgi:hypothetical protein